MSRKIITQNFKKKTQYFFAISVFSAFILRPFSHVPCQKSARFRCAAEFCLYPSRKYNFYAKIIKKIKEILVHHDKITLEFLQFGAFCFHSKGNFDHVSSIKTHKISLRGKVCFSSSQNTNFFKTL